MPNSDKVFMIIPAVWLIVRSSACTDWSPRRMVRGGRSSSRLGGLDAFSLLWPEGLSDCRNSGGKGAARFRDGALAAATCAMAVLEGVSATPVSGEGAPSARATTHAASLLQIPKTDAAHSSHAMASAIVP